MLFFIVIFTQYLFEMNFIGMLKEKSKMEILRPDSNFATSARLPRKYGIGSSGMNSFVFVRSRSVK